MGHIFRINKKGAASTKSAIVDWGTSGATTYNYGYVDSIQDSTIKQEEITSIPSPFARIELVKEAFRKVVPTNYNQLDESQLKESLHGTTIFHKMVSDSLDVAQLFFSYPTMEDKLDIIVWDRARDLAALKQSSDPQHRIVAKTLDMYFEQDAKGNDPYNFAKMKKMYILRYKGLGQKQMHIIGATSPATLFFSTANSESAISKNLCFGTDYAFDKDYASLDMRDPEFLKYLFAFRYSDKDFNTLYPEVANYMDAVYYVLNNEIKEEINNIQALCQTVNTNGTTYIDSTYNKLDVTVGGNAQYSIEINGKPFHCKKVEVFGHSDFMISPEKNVDVMPLVLPIVKSQNYERLTYYGSDFGRNFLIPCYDSTSLKQRKLPGINIAYPYLTISDFLDDTLVKLQTAINKENFFDGNLLCRDDRREGYLLPLKDLFFDYFTVEYLQGLSPSGKKTFEMKAVASSIEVILRIPIQKGCEVEYKRMYTMDVKANQEANQGEIVEMPEEFAVGIFPLVTFSNPEDANYRIILASDFNTNKGCSCQCHNSEKGFFSPDYVVRNNDDEDDYRKKSYIVEGTAFDCIRLNLMSGMGHTRNISGIIIPKFKTRKGNATFSFAIDLGTSNTHIEYTTGMNQNPQPFEYSKEKPQISFLYDIATVLDNHIAGEFLPPCILKGSECSFPMRTVLCEDKVNTGRNEKVMHGAYEPLGNASPAFLYNQNRHDYNEYIPNLKWSQNDLDSIDHIRCYIESLFLMMRTKVIQEGGSLHQTQVKWFYPISMSPSKRNIFELEWDKAYKKYFNPNGHPIAITESIAPYSYFQQTRPNVTNIVTIDIGGGTTDIVVADLKEVKFVSSMRFAADAIFGNNLVGVQNGKLNGIIRLCKDEFMANLEGHSELHKMFSDMTANDNGNSSEVASFLFSLIDNSELAGLGDKVNFNSYLMRNDSLKIIFLIFYSAIIYYLAHLMKAKQIPSPENIAFSGNGSKILSVLSPNSESLEKLTNSIFRLVYERDIERRIKLIINKENPKEATCKGGLLLQNVPQDIESSTCLLFNVSEGKMCKDERYEDINQTAFNHVVNDVNDFCDFIALRTARDVSFSREFGISKASLDLAVECFNENLSTYVEKGIDLKLKAGDVHKDDKIEDPLFFYPIMGVLSDLSNRICELNQ